MNGRGAPASKERMKEGKEKDARYTNGHLFTTITVSGMTMCFACNKSITAKEALICPTCNVTIHNRCKDTLPNCTKVKQKQQKAALLKNSTALQSVSLRNKGAPRERPNSAVYPSESFRQSLLGPRRGRPSLSLSKSVSTTNIAGTFNEESALGIRRILSQSTDSLNVRNRTVSVESLIEEGPDAVLQQLLAELEADERDFAADSWSLAVDGAFLQLQRADVMRRQDVIYELMQTELHHVRTLKIMGGVLRRAMLEELQLQPGAVNAVFPCVDELSALHQRFLAQLLQRRRLSLVGGSSKNFVIQRLGDLLVSQFSGQSAEQLRKCYAEFCSKHSAALREYKELLARDKRLQAFVRRTARSPLLRRHGVPECILLVTQRITKYPVLIERILRHSREDEAEAAELSRALLLVKDLISAINAEVREHELRMRLYDVYRRVDGRAKLQLRGDGRPGSGNGNGNGAGSGCATFGRDELLRRKLLHSGCVLWKTAAGRFKDVLLLLMTDVIVFLQEKDQKLSFPTMDKPAVISLHELIVRDVANQEKGLFLLSAAPPEMYELHAASRDERTLWMRLIQQAVSQCPSRQDFPLIETEVEASLRKLRERLQQQDRQIAALLKEKLALFADMAALRGGGDDPTAAQCPTALLHRDPHGANGTALLLSAIREVESLQEAFIRDRECSNDSDGPTANNGDADTFNGAVEMCGADSESGQRDGNGNQVPPRVSQEEVNQRLNNLYSLLLELQAQRALQDTRAELQFHAERSAAPPPPPRSPPHSAPPAAPPPAPPPPEAQLALLQRQHALLQEELQRCRRQLHERAEEAAALRGRLREAEGGRSCGEADGRAAGRGGEKHSPSGSPPPCDAAPLFVPPPPPEPHEDPEAPPGGADAMEELLGQCERSPPGSPRDFVRMQDIPEEGELREGEGGSSDS